MSTTLRAAMFLLYGDPKVCGKALPVSANVLTPTGWKRMGDIVVGDIVVDPATGTGTTVTGVFDQGMRDVFAVEFDDGVYVLADAEHLWRVQSYNQWNVNGGWQVRSTREMADRGIRRLKGTLIYWSIPVCAPVEWSDSAPTPLDPYVVGVLLGDGCLRTGVRFTTADHEILEHVTRSVTAIGACIRPVTGTKYDHSISGSSWRTNPVRAALVKLGMMGKMAYEKSVPPEYLRASVADRLALLQGIMDTDGEALRKGCRASFSTTSPQLRDDVVDLVRSLGGVATFQRPRRGKYKDKHGNVVLCRISWRLSIQLPVCPFRLTRKAERWAPLRMKRSIYSVEPAGTVECRCISVASKDHTFITDHYVVTHNTTLTLRTFPRACVIGVRSAIELVAQNTCGFTPPWIVETVTTLPELVGFLRWFISPEGVAVRKRMGTNEIVVDDLSQMCSKSMLLWRVEGGKDRYYAFNQLDQHLDWMASLLRETGLLCALSAHKTSPMWSKEQTPTLISPGAPEVPSRNQLQAVPGWVDFVAPVEPSTLSIDPWWPRVIRVEQSASPTWVAGDRNGVCWEATPANLREILLASKSNYDLPRFPGLEWQDETAQVVCDALFKDEPVLSVIERVFAHYRDYAIPDSAGERHVQWACQDGIARYVIQKRKRAGVLGAIRDSAARASALAPPPPPAAGGG